jgi:hypothetical protein
MTPRLRTLGLCWLVIAIALEYGSGLGGDASKLWGWILLIWTAPFSLIYQFVLYDIVLGIVSRPTAQLVGAVFEVGLGYLLWFIILPRVHRKSQPAI